MADEQLEHFVVNIEITKVTRQMIEVPDRAGRTAKIPGDRVMDQITHIVQKGKDLDGAIELAKRHLGVVQGTETGE